MADHSKKINQDNIFMIQCFVSMVMKMKHQLYHYLFSPT